MIKQYIAKHTDIPNFKIKREKLLTIKVNLEFTFLGSYDDKVYAPLHIITIEFNCYNYDESILDNTWICWSVSPERDCYSRKIPSKFHTSTETEIHKKLLYTKVNRKSTSKQFIVFFKILLQKFFYLIIIFLHIENGLT